jgi:hypothetical protein
MGKWRLMPRSFKSVSGSLSWSMAGWFVVSCAAPARLEPRPASVATAASTASAPAVSAPAASTQVARTPLMRAPAASTQPVDACTGVGPLGCELAQGGELPRDLCPHLDKCLRGRKIATESGDGTVASVTSCDKPTLLGESHAAIAVEVELQGEGGQYSVAYLLARLPSASCLADQLLVPTIVRASCETDFKALSKQSQDRLQVESHRICHDVVDQEEVNQSDILSEDCLRAEYVSQNARLTKASETGGSVANFDEGIYRALTRKELKKLCQTVNPPATQP